MDRHEPFQGLQAVEGHRAGESAPDGRRPLYAVLPWGGWEAERTSKIIGDDWYPYGIEKNRPTIDALCQYSFEQGLSQRRMTVEELFAPETFDEFKI